MRPTRRKASKNPEDSGSKGRRSGSSQARHPIPAYDSDAIRTLGPSSPLRSGEKGIGDLKPF